MTQQEQIQAAVKKTQELAARCSASETSDNYEFLEVQIDELESQAQQAFRSKVDFASLLSKLRGLKPLTPGDVKTLELLIVGDAEYYVKYESELDEWRAQLRRVLEQIANLASSALDVDGLMHLRALCREAHEVLADLVFYFDARDRAAKFQATTQGPINNDGYRFLADIVRDMISSSKG